MFSVPAAFAVCWRFWAGRPLQIAVFVEVAVDAVWCFCLATLRFPCLCALQFLNPGPEVLCAHVACFVLLVIAVCFLLMLSMPPQVR